MEVSQWHRVDRRVADIRLTSQWNGRLRAAHSGAAHRRVGRQLGNRACAVQWLPETQSRMYKSERFKDLCLLEPCAAAVAPGRSRPPLGYPRETSVGPGSPRVHASATACSRRLATESAAFVRSRNAKVGRGVNEARQKHWIVAISLFKRSHLALGSKGTLEQARARAKTSGLACQGARQ